MAAIALVPLADATAAPTTVSGTLKGGSGYTLNVLTPSGQAVSQRLRGSGRFKLRLGSRQARGATLQLVGRDGRYYGPIVLAARRRKAHVALAGRSVSLGRIRLRGGHARPARTPDRRALSRAVVRADARGKPVGAGRLGLVGGARGVRAAQDGSDGAGADPDRDGIPSAHDADDDGDLALDAVDSGAGASNAGLFSTLFLGYTEALNANAGATPEQVDPIIAGENRFNLVFYFDAGRLEGRTASSAHVNCFALSYCRRGDGTAILGGVTESSPDLPRDSLWTDYSPDGSGYPNLERIERGGFASFVAGVQPRATTSQIRPGDTYNVEFDTDRGDVIVPTSLASYFVTTPAITSYSSGGETTQVTYPIPPGSPGCCRPGEGSPEGNPIQLNSERLTLSLWRPQRAGIPGAESGGFTDMGGLHYGVVPSLDGQSREFSCAGHYSDLSPTLSAEPSTGAFAEEGARLFPLVDSAEDAPPSPSRTLSFTVDLGACLRAAGEDPAGRSVGLTLTAASEQRPGGQDRAAQQIAVRLP